VNVTDAREDDPENEWLLFISREIDRQPIAEIQFERSQGCEGMKTGDNSID